MHVVDIERRQNALNAAVLYFGLACMAPDAVPARADTVIATARKFEKYLNEVGNGQH